MHEFGARLPLLQEGAPLPVPRIDDKMALPERRKPQPAHPLPLSDDPGLTVRRTDSAEAPPAIRCQDAEKLLGTERAAGSQTCLSYVPNGLWRCMNGSKSELSGSFTFGTINSGAVSGSCEAMAASISRR